MAVPGLFGIAAPGALPPGWRFVAPSPRVITLGQPLAGQGWSWDAPQGQLLRLLAAYTTLTTSATAATRRAVLHVTGPGDTPLAVIYSGAVVKASEVSQIGWLVGGPSSGFTVGRVTQGLGDLLWPPGCTVSVEVETVQDGDQLSDVALLVNLV